MGMATSGITEREGCGLGWKGKAVPLHPKDSQLAAVEEKLEKAAERATWGAWFWQEVRPATCWEETARARKLQAHVIELTRNRLNFQSPE